MPGLAARAPAHGDALGAEQTGFRILRQEDESRFESPRASAHVEGQRLLSNPSKTAISPKHRLRRQCSWKLGVCSLTARQGNSSRMKSKELHTCTCSQLEVVRQKHR